MNRDAQRAGHDPERSQNDKGNYSELVHKNKDGDTGEDSKPGPVSVSRFTAAERHSRPYPEYSRFPDHYRVYRDFFPLFRDRAEFLPAGFVVLKAEDALVPFLVWVFAEFLAVTVFFPSLPGL